MRKGYYLGILAILLILFAVFSNLVDFHDATEYITVSKMLAGINNLNVFSTHSIAYPLIISFFLRIWPSLTMIKLVNVFWIFAISSIFLIWLKNKRIFLLFVFSPLTWYVAIQTTPVLPASFFFLLAYIFFKRTEIKYNKIYSGLCLGLSFAFYTPMIIIISLFLLIYFWKEPFENLIKYGIGVLIGILPRLITEFIIFGNPAYSLIRYFGTNLIVFLGLNPGTQNLHFLNNLAVFSIIFVISPLLFKIYQINWRNYKKEIWFLILSGTIIFIRGAQIKYFFILSPIVLVLLNKTLSEKEVRINCFISSAIIAIIIFGFFGTTDDFIIKRDIEKIIDEFEIDYIIAGPYEAAKIAMFLWKDYPKVIWFMNLKATKNNEEILKEYSFKLNQNMKFREDVIISATFKRPNNQTYQDYILVTEKKFEGLEECQPIKCYDKLCVYEKCFQ